MNDKFEIFFSYAWGDEREPGESREKIVNELYTSLIRDNFRVIRDKYNLEYKGFISEFMTRIGKGKCVVVAISSKYVKSPYCMFELYEIARQSNFDKHLFADKVVPIMAEFIDFADAAVIDEYLTYWNNEYNEWNELIKRHAGQLAVEQMQRFDKIRMIHQNFGKLAEWIMDMNSLNPRLLAADNFGIIKEAIKEKAVRVEKKTRLLSKPLLWLGAAVVITLVAWTIMTTGEPTPSNNNSTKDTITSIDISDSPKVTQPQKPAETITQKPVTPKPQANNNRPESTASTGVTIVEPEPALKICTVYCDTKNISGVEISFIDPEEPKRYAQVSNGSVMEFHVPCYMLKKPVTVNFKNSQHNEDRTFEGNQFEFPALFTRTNP